MTVVLGEKNSDVVLLYVVKNCTFWNSKKTTKSEFIFNVHLPRPVGPTQNAATQKNEIFVDILERITVLLNSSG
jgi:hypothetical protein